MSISLALSFSLTSCCCCGVAFAVPDDFLQKRREDKRTFYCPNGHTLGYTTNEADRLRDQLAANQRMLDQANNRQQALADQLATELRAKKRLLKRLESGVCPVPGCKRHFTNLQQHITTEHKGMVLPPAANEPKMLPAGKVQ